MKIVSLFSGCGGLDLGFTLAGFTIVYGNDNDPTVWETYQKNHGLSLDQRSLLDVQLKDIPDADGIIGGPPCQSWSVAGLMRGVNDKRGKLFYDYLRILEEKKPKFFLIENVPGIMSRTHIKEYNTILSILSSIGYKISDCILDARDYDVPQERKRVFIIGYRQNLGKRFEYPAKRKRRATLRTAIGDLPESTPGIDRAKPNLNLAIPNHEHLTYGFSYIYMSRNRRRTWDDQSFTIQAGGRYAPLHPSSTEMVKVCKDHWMFKGTEPTFRRLSIRECARIQTFPDDFIFYYKRLVDGYNMVGNAVPVELARALALKIKKDLP